MIVRKRAYDISLIGIKFPVRSYSKENVPEDGGYMHRRLAALAEESRPLKDDPKAGKPYFPDESNVTPPDISQTSPHKSHQQIIDEIYAKVENSKYNYLHQDKIAYSKIPASAPKQAREIAESVPWSGSESIHDSNLRMLVDAHKPLKPGLAGRSGGNLKLPKFKPPPSTSERLFKARESSLDYSLNKNASENTIESDNKISANDAPESGPTFKEMYKERLLGPSGIPSTFAAINSLASQRIEDAIARGQFRDLPRGKPIERDHHTSSPYIDTTEYFLNKIIQRQGAAPPWIEKQMKLNTSIEQFRTMLSDRWQKRAILKIISEAGISVDSKRAIGDNEVENAVRIATQYSNNEKSNSSKNLLRDNEWLSMEQKYHELLVADINNTIRGYNLQAPGSARKGYLELEKELTLSYQTVSKRLPTAVKRYLVPDEELFESSAPVSISKDDLHKQSELYIEDASNHYGLSHLFRDVVARVWKKR